MIVLVGCPRRAALVIETEVRNAREARECRSGDRHVDDRGRGGGVLGRAGDLVSGDVVHFGDGYLLPIHETPAGERVTVSFNADAGITCSTCRELIEPLLDRQQVAREAFQDAAAEETPEDVRTHLTRAVEAAIEVATRVKLERDIFNAFFAASPDTFAAEENPNWRPALTAAFRAAGFEVVE
jgi:hypothetical protein